MSLGTLQKWLVDKCTVIQTDLANVGATKSKAPTETTIATGVKCRFDKSGGSLEQTMLGQQRIVQRKVFLGPDPIVKPTWLIQDEATGEKFLVLDAFKFPDDGHQELTVERRAA